MFRSRTLLQLISCSLLLLGSLCGCGESRPQEAHQGAPGEGRAHGHRVLLLEAVKTGILGSLGMDREPRPTREASAEELRRMYRLYEEKVREMRGNSSQLMKDTRQSTMSTVLFPETVERLKRVQKGKPPHPRSGPRTHWHTAVFHRTSDIHTELTVTRAELKISWRILGKPTSVQPETRGEIQVRVNGRTWRSLHSPTRTNVSRTQDLMLDIRPEVEKWFRAEAGEPLVVVVGTAAVKDPTLSLELGLTQPKPARKARLPRSNKEDVCSEQGWCCRKSVTVSFKDIGWTDWVVAPADYTMHFCDGTCPHNYKPASMHTQVKSRLHQITKGGSPRPCCVPAAYEPMVLMHYDSWGKLKLTPFDDLIVSKCHCA
ncbi:inhibin beta E chain [Spinachia spinachia]